VRLLLVVPGLLLSQVALLLLNLKQGSQWLALVHQQHARLLQGPQGQYLPSLHLHHAVAGVGCPHPCCCHWLLGLLLLQQRARPGQLWLPERHQHCAQQPLSYFLLLLVLVLLLPRSLLLVPLRQAQGQPKQA
jgi:hypothetical protein